jgi:mono/diheme cytochrome c family protein
MATNFKRYGLLIGVCLSAGGMLWACGNDNSSSGSGGGGETTPTTPTTPTSPTASSSEYNATYKAIFNTNCVGCHNAGDSFDLSTFEKIKANRTKITSRIESTRNPMPPSASAQWKNTDKARVLQYLKTSTEFN